MADDVRESVKIVALSVLAAIVYGVVHDQITARVCLEYFTVAHRDVAGHDPTGIGLYWGVVATWWVGLPLGVAVAVASRAGRRAPASVGDVAPRIAKMLAASLALAMATGTIGYLAATHELVSIAACYRDAIPSEHRAAFVFDAWAHSTSYIAGVCGGLWVGIATFRARPTLEAPEPISRRSVLTTFGCLAIIAAPLSWFGLMLALMAYEDRPIGSGSWLAHALWPWFPYAVGAAGVAALGWAATRRRTKSTQPDESRARLQ